ncbi:MAG: transcriptional regulator [Candidatus Aminicenantes bacterium]|nr:MAG: transcriptional regulator [Candidatus Aminicenantes bacterium]
MKKNNNNIIGVNLKPIENIDRVVHEPARFLILAYLYVVKKADFLFLLRQTNLTRGNLSSHLNKLEAARYVKIEKRFVDKIPRTRIFITEKGRKAFHTYKQNLTAILEKLPGSK